MRKMLIVLIASSTLYLFSLIGLEMYVGYQESIRKTAIWQPYNTIITNKEAKTVFDYHGILSMKWSIPHKDFIFERDGKICKTRAFEIIKEAEKLK